MMMGFLAKRRGAIEALAGVAVVLLLLVGTAITVKALKGWIAALVLLGVTVLLVFLTRRLRKRVPRHTILELDLEGGVVEQIPPGIGRLLDPGALRLRDIVDALERASGDERVEALVVRVGGSGIGTARAQEVRDAVTAFRAAGKRAVAFAETFGENSDGMADYYLATAFDQISLQPGGSLGLVGLVSRVSFIKGVFDKIGIVPHIDAREEYKTARYRLTETGFTDAHRESVNSILGSHYDIMIDGIAAGRGLQPADVRSAIDRGPLLPGEAVESGLVDELAYRDQVYDRLKEATGGKTLHLSTYVKRAGRPHRKGAGVGIIYATGDVTRGAARFSVVPTVGYTMGSDTVAKAFREAVKNPKVKAIVFRVDTRGGSAVASDVILREVVRAREAGKPVVVTMGDYAASGGYYISARADKIVAQPGTVTGSIGVVSGKLITAAAWDKIGITSDREARGDNALFFSADVDYSESEEARMQAVLDDIYDRFVGEVATGRGVDPARARELAKGKVYTGVQAKESGLVDELGGVPTALRLAKEAAGIEETAAVKMIEFPKRARRLPWQREESSDAAAMLADAARVMAPFGGAMAAAFPRGELVLPAGY